MLKEIRAESRNKINYSNLPRITASVNPFRKYLGVHEGINQLTEESKEFIFPENVSQNSVNSPVNNSVKFKVNSNASTHKIEVKKDVSHSKENGWQQSEQSDNDRLSGETINSQIYFSSEISGISERININNNNIESVISLIEDSTLWPMNEQMFLSSQNDQTECEENLLQSYDSLFSFMQSNQWKFPFIEQKEFQNWKKRIRQFEDEEEGSKVEMALPNYLQISKTSFLKLKGNEWYNDEIINSYIELIYRKFQEKLKNVYIFNTYFFEKLTNEYNYTKLSKFMKKRISYSENGVSYSISPLENSDEFRIFYVPVILDSHWSLVKVDRVNHHMEYFDSLIDEDRGIFCIKSLSIFFDDLNRNNGYSQVRWTYEIKRNIPNQTNLNDCGVFLCLYLKYLVLNQTFNFEGEDIPFFRILIGVEIGEGAIKV